MKSDAAPRTIAATSQEQTKNTGFCRRNAASDMALSPRGLVASEGVHGPACVLEGLSQAVAGVVSSRALSRHVGAREGALPPDQQQDRTPHPLPQGRRE